MRILRQRLHQTHPPGDALENAHQRNALRLRHVRRPIQVETVLEKPFETGAQLRGKGEGVL